MKKAIAQLLFFAAMPLLLQAQPYGFEWIKPYQPYYKFKIPQTGVYRIPASLLSASGINLSNMNPGRFQVFKNGKEIPLFIHGATDGQVNGNDFIEFYAEQNDGEQDKELYANPSDQPHSYYSMVSDTAAYFLTILPDTSVLQGKRFEPFTENNYGSYTPETFFMHEEKFFRADEYVDGINLNAGGEKYNSSEYTDGEGWAAARVGLGGSATYTVNTPFPFATGPLPTVETKVIGVSDYYLGNPTVNHHVQMSVAPAENPVFSVYKDFLFKGYISQQYSGALNYSQIGNGQTLFRLSVINDLFVASDFNCLSYIRLVYARQYQLGGTTNLRLKVLHNQNGTRSLIQFSGYGNGAQNSPVIFDFTNGKRITSIVNAGIARALVENNGQPTDIFLFDSLSASNVLRLEPVSFSFINPAQNYEFILVSHEELSDAATQYANYRSQRFKVLNIKASSLYDLYTYGNPHPLALRRMAKHLINLSTATPQYLLLLGKGYQTNLLRNQRYYEANLVPALGVPSADHLISAGIKGNGFVPEIATGRIAAVNNAEALNYLQKLIYYETHPDSILSWRKNILHITGGENQNQQNAFKFFMNGNTNVIKGKSFGANVTSYNKSTTEPTQGNLRDKLMQVVNDGVSMLTFLGHGSATVLDVNIGSLAELNNINKYPFYYFNGCNVGNPSDMDPSNKPDIYGIDFICAANKGAIGWLAHSNLTLDGSLYRQINLFYNSFSNSHYGKPIGTILREALKAGGVASLQDKSHNMQLTLQGDPAVRIYSPLKPDYKVSLADVYTIPQNPNAVMDSFRLAVVVNNYGRANDDTVEVSLKRTLPDNSVVQYAPVSITDLYLKDTVYFWVKAKELKSFGNNQFDISIDAQAKLDEISRLNNEVRYTLFLPSSGITLLSPMPYAVAGNDSVEFIIQNNDFFAKNIGYEIELDTTVAFNSPLLKRSGIIKGNTIIKWLQVITTADTIVYYWRAKTEVNPEWVTGSFTHIPAAEDGWMQSHYNQWEGSTGKVNMETDTVARRLAFVPNSQLVISKIGRWHHSNLGIYDPYIANPGAGGCLGGGGTVCLIYDGSSLSRMEAPGIPYNCNPVPGYAYYVFKTGTIAGQDDFIRFMDTLRVGTYMAIYSFYDAGIPSWKPELRARLAQFGSLKVANAQSQFTAFTLIGRKGETPGMASEDTLFNDRFTTGDSVVCEAQRLLEGKWFTGSITSARIGPVKQWNKVLYKFHSLENNGYDRQKVYLIGITQNNEDSILATDIASGFDISTINTTVFPYLKLKAEFLDSFNRTPNQFGYWMVTYSEPTEGLIDNKNYQFHASRIQQGDSLHINLSFTNIHKQPFDSVPCLLTIRDPKNAVIYSVNKIMSRIEKDQSVVFSDVIATRNFSAGMHTLNVSFNYQQQIPEFLIQNNLFEQKFDVWEDKSNPMLDVTFDGFRIMNGDFVSPTPVIRITSKDDNKFLLQQDTNTFSLFLKRPTQAIFEQIPLNSSYVNFVKANAEQNTAMLEFTPEKLTDGLYTLRVQSRDATGNVAGNNAYEIDFNVVNESTITAFFPYPNPATTNIRFVFTLTGSKVPDELLVRITTLSGKIVKEITRAEFGDMKIGHNISQFAWDGNDTYGDRLANGVYLYQVFTRINGQDIKKRNTSADQFVLHNVGKIYLMK